MFFLRSEAEGGFNSDQIEILCLLLFCLSSLNVDNRGKGSKDLCRHRERIFPTAC